MQFPFTCRLVYSYVSFTFRLAFLLMYIYVTFIFRLRFNCPSCGPYYVRRGRVNNLQIALIDSYLGSKVLLRLRRALRAVSSMRKTPRTGSDVHPAVKRHKKGNNTTSVASSSVVSAVQPGSLSTDLIDPPIGSHEDDHSSVECCQC